MKFRNASRPDPVGFQMTPMIDTVFLLLCFFVASQVFSQWELEIDVSLPTARTAEIPQRLPGEIIINILKTGETIVNGRTLDEAALSVMLKDLVRLFPGQPIVLRADKATAYEHLIRILDLCRQADIWNISFATSLPES